MPSTMDQLQQLTNNELFIMCNDYHIASREIAYLTRRQLERRLHVAIIGERAKMRAHDLVNSVRFQQDQMFLHGWLHDTQCPNTILGRPMPLSTWRNYHANKQETHLPIPPRFRGGVEYLRHLQHLRHYPGDYESEPSQDESQESFEDDDYEQDMKHQHWQDAYRSPIEPMAAISTTYIERDATREATTDYYSLSNDDESRTTLHRDCNQLQKAERFAWLKVSTHDMPQESERDVDSTSEQELCTIKYLEEFPPGDVNLKPQSSSKEFIDLSATLNVGDSLAIDQSPARPRRSLWRYVYDLLFCDTEGKFNAGKLRYSIFCCALVICTFVGFKMLP